MTATLAAPALQSTQTGPAVSAPDPPLRLERRHLLASLAVLFVFFSVYQTLVQTVLTDDAVRKALDIDEYDMTWQQVGYGVGLMYGLFTGMWLSVRIGGRYTIALGLFGFAFGNLLCGAAFGLESFVLGRFVRRLRQDDGHDRLPAHALQAIRSLPTRGDWLLRDPGLLDA